MLCILIPLLIITLPLGAETTAPMSFEYPGTVLQGRLQQTEYDRMDAYVGYKNHTVFGPSWSQRYTNPGYKSFSQFKKQFTAFIEKELSKKSSKVQKGEKHYRFVYNHQTYWLHIDMRTQYHTITLLLETPYTSALVFDQSKPLQYSDNLIKRGTSVPKHHLIPFVNGYEIKRAKYSDHKSMKFRYPSAANRTHVQTAAGHYWHLDFISKEKKRGMNNRYMIFQNYKDELNRIGAEILDEKKDVIIFRLSRGEHVIFVAHSLVSFVD